MKKSRRSLKERKVDRTRSSHAECLALLALLLSRIDSSANPILYNVSLPTIDPNGSSSSVDLVVLTKGGIFVIDVVCRNCLVVPREYSAYWATFYGSTFHPMRNPVTRNDAHLRVLADKLELSPKFFHGIVSFSPWASFRPDFPEGVLTRERVPDFILSLADHALLDPAQLPILAQKILSISLPSSLSSSPPFSIDQTLSLLHDKVLWDKALVDDSLLPEVAVRFCDDDQSGKPLAVYRFFCERYGCDPFRTELATFVDECLAGEWPRSTGAAFMRRIISLGERLDPLPSPRKLT